MDLIILPEFQHLLPGTPEASDAELEKQLVEAGGALDPITIWKGRNIIVDGHRRYAICKRLGLPFKVREMEFADEDEAKNWMDCYQFSRRNLDAIQEALVIGRILKRRSKKGEYGQGNRNRIRSEIAKAAGISMRSVYRAEETSKAIDTLPGDLREDLKSVAAKTSAPAVKKLATLPRSEQREAVAAVKSGEAPNLATAVKLEQREKRAKARGDEEEPEIPSSSPSRREAQATSALMKALMASWGKFNLALNAIKHLDMARYRVIRGMLEDMDRELTAWRDAA